MTDQTVLEQAIITYNEAYRKGNPLILDSEYDDLVDTLKKVYPDSNLFKKGVIKQLKESRKQKLPIPMYSLDKCKILEEIMKWSLSKNLYLDTILTISPKYDGVSLIVDEQYKIAWTRGDGEVGQISTKHFRKMNGYSPQEFLFHSFGEAIMSRKNWVQHFEGQINPETGKLYTNPRNTVAGWLNRDSPTDLLRYVDYIRYGSTIERDRDHQQATLNYLNFVEVNLFSCKLSQLTSSMLENLYQRWSKDYQIDGLVIEVNDFQLRKGLGREENMNPAYAIAYKNPEWSSSAIVDVLDIEWNISKQGKLKPIIQIEPTEVAGVTISNVTGYNAKYIFDNNINKGSVIKIIRSGDVIPKHIETISFSETDMQCLADSLVECPCCGGVTKWDETMTELICSNSDCRDQKIAKLGHFFSVMEIEDFGEPSIIKLYNKGYDTIEKILALVGKNVIASIDGFGLKSESRFVDQIMKLKEVGVPAAKFIHALDLMDGKIGEKTIQLILDNMSQRQISDYREIRVEDLVNINGVAQITAEVFLKGYRDFIENSGAIPVEIKHVQSPRQEVVGDKYKGQRICFTGCRPSKELQSEIESQGGEVVDGVSKNTTLLVVRDYSEKTMKSSKTVNAQKLNIQIVRIEEL